MGSLRRLSIAACGLLALFAISAPAQAAFPGKNGKIAFVSDRDAPGTGTTDIYTMNSDGSDVRRLTTDPQTDDNPAWSPDGSKIAFDGFRDGWNAVVVMNADGTDQRPITGPGYFYPTGQPAWSPDGGKIVFQAVTAYEDTELYVIDADGTGPVTRLTYNEVNDEAPAWSPDGSEIAFERYVPPCTTPFCNFEIFVMSADGTNQRRLTFDDYPDTVPSWSPDGRRIAWGHLGSNARWENLVMNADGTDQRSFVPSAPGDEPAWSPDGRQIAFAAPGDGDNGWDIDVMNADGSGQHAISSTRFFESRPDWQPIPGPQRGDYKNAAKFCEADRAFLGDAAFAKKYGTNGDAANAYGKCVSQNTQP